MSLSKIELAVIPQAQARTVQSPRHPLASPEYPSFPVRELDILVYRAISDTGRHDAPSRRLRVEMFSAFRLVPQRGARASVFRVLFASSPFRPPRGGHASPRGRAVALSRSVDAGAFARQGRRAKNSHVRYQSCTLHIIIPQPRLIANSC